ncbi:hypothetical protein [Methylophaga sp.]|uniref:hypothetical protein n=1 Tax=Methylophaga sp. TaxID=2024840 RepID=UPI003A8CE5B7
MIKPQEVNRDENGFWTHSHFPDFDECEHPTKEQIDKWCRDNYVTFETVWFESDASEELNERYYEQEDGGACAEWQPKAKHKDAFLFSIHDTEDGPVAVFAIPTNLKVKND